MQSFDYDSVQSTQEHNMKSTGIGPRSSPSAMKKLRSRRRLGNQIEKSSKISEFSS